MNKKENIVIVISGPTASGKTSTSLRLAKLLGEAAVVNFDSLLFYNELNIWTAKPNAKELAEVEHHLVDICSAKNHHNASDYIELAEQKIIELHKDNKAAILVGGSGFYLRALLKGMYESKKSDEALRLELDKELKENGITPFIDFLKEHDPESLEQLHENDHYRLVRAVEHFKTTGTKISEEKKKLDEARPYDFSVNKHPNWNIFHLYLDLPKDQHLKIIEARATQMIDEGLVEEVKNLLASGFSGDEKPLGSIGYKETIDYINGLFKSKEDYLERIVISTRQLAKSQRTFFKKVTPKETHHPLNDVEEIDKKVLEFIKA